MILKGLQTMRRLLLLSMIAAAAFASAARAEVVDSQANGFMVREIQSIAAPPAKVWDAMGRIGAWWNPQHTYDNDSSRLSLTLKPGGAFSEALGTDGGVMHMTVIYARPPKMLRMEGALGPLQLYGVAGHMTWDLKATGATTTVVLTYDVGGHAPGGLGQFSGPVNEVVGEQLLRLKHYVETGKPI
jgi:uncharacterized protein YndB with AHSA1/START domain